MAAGTDTIDQGRPPVRLYLMAEAAGPAAAPAGALGELLAAADVAAVLLRIEYAAERDMIAAVKQFAETVQAAGTALLVADHPDIVARSGADGAHVSGIAAVSAALPVLKPRWIVGAGGLRSRHDAMLAAEAGADYVMFGEPGAEGRRPGFDAVLDRVAWWTPLFEVPCVAYAASLDQVSQLCEAGADFIAVGPELLSDPRGPVTALREAATRLQQPAGTPA